MITVILCANGIGSYCKGIVYDDDDYDNDDTDGDADDGAIKENVRGTWSLSPH